MVKAFYVGTPTNCDYRDATLWRLERPINPFGTPAAYIVAGRYSGVRALDGCRPSGVRIGSMRPLCPGWTYQGADEALEQLFARYRLIPVREPRQMEFDLPERQVS